MKIMKKIMVLLCLAVITLPAIARVATTSGVDYDVAPQIPGYQVMYSPGYTGSSPVRPSYMPVAQPQPIYQPAYQPINYVSPGGYSDSYYGYEQPVVQQSPAPQLRQIEQSQMQNSVIAIVFEADIPNNYKASIENVLKTAPSTLSVGLRAFGSVSQGKDELGYANEKSAASTRRVVAPSPNNSNVARTTLINFENECKRKDNDAKSRPYMEMSYYDVAIKTAAELDLARVSGYKRVLMIVTGKPATRYGASKEEMINQPKNICEIAGQLGNYAGITVDSIILGETIKDAYKEDLVKGFNCAASASGGRTYYATDTADLERALAKMLK